MEETEDIMSNIIQYLSISLPLIATICNIFLLFTLLTAKKTGPVKSIMFLLSVFILWTIGSAFMRLNVYPSMEFWWKVSLTGLFLVPYSYYIVACSFVNKKGYIPKIIYGIVTVIIVIMNMKNAFLTVPTIILQNGIEVISYTITNLAFIPVITSVIMLANSWIILLSEIKYRGLKPKYIRPFVTGILVMALGVLLDLIPLFNSLPMDTLACAINAIFIYKAFTMRRLYPKNQITSTGGMFILSIIITTLFASPVYDLIHYIIEKDKDTKITQTNVIVIIILATVAISLFIVLNKMNEKIFIKDKNKKEINLKKFSKHVAQSLKEDEILESFYNLVKSDIKFDHLYILKYKENEKKYITYDFLNNLESSLEIFDKNPIISYLSRDHRGVLYEDFMRSTDYKAMWEDEKNLFNKIGATYFLPFFDNEKIIVLAIFSKNKDEKSYSFDDLSYMDSIASIAAVGLKNANLYSILEKEAQNDSLTELLNRRTFTRKCNEMIQTNISPLTLIMFDLDDLYLYNQLYGNEEGDELLKRFSSILKSNFESNAVISRYGAKEFAVLLPLTDSYKALEITNSIKSQINYSIDLNDEKIAKFLTFSAGISTYPTVATSQKDLISKTDEVIRYIKHSGKNDAKIYNEEFEKTNKNITREERFFELNSFILTVTEMIDQKDHYTFNHSNAVSHYASALAKCAGLSDDMIETVRQCGLLHDIGKNGIPEAILTKQGRLTDEEYTIMKKHPQNSKDIIRRFPDTEYLIPGVYSHHERYDGRGYPRGIKGEDIPLEGRILAIADSFDAMVSKRSYKEKMPVELACGEIIKNLGTQFDPKLGQLFVDKIKSKEISIKEY